MTLFLESRAECRLKVIFHIEDCDEFQDKAGDSFMTAGMASGEPLRQRSVRR